MRLQPGCKLHASKPPMLRHSQVRDSDAGQVDGVDLLSSGTANVHLVNDGKVELGRKLRIYATLLCPVSISATAMRDAAPAAGSPWGLVYEETCTLMLGPNLSRAT